MSFPQDLTQFVFTTGENLPLTAEAAELGWYIKNVLVLPIIWFTFNKH